MRSRLAASVLVPALAVVLAACGAVQTPPPAPAAPSPTPLTGFAAMNPKIILRFADAAMASLNSVHAGGLLGSFGTVSFDTDTKGNCSGSLLLYGEPVQLISTSGRLYVKTNSAYWARFLPAATAKKLANKWATGFADTFAKNCNIVALTRQDSALGKARSHTVGMSTVDGQSAVEIRVKQKTGGEKDLWVGIAEPHYLLRATADSGKQDITFSKFNRPLHLSAPRGAVNVHSLK